jgi:hypothetical protein
MFIQQYIQGVLWLLSGYLPLSTLAYSTLVIVSLYIYIIEEAERA